MNVSEIGLSTKASVLKEARAIATYHLGGQTASAKECILQRMFSRTIDVAMKDKKHYIIQLRAESVHEENAQQAHDILGNVVPVPVRVVREGSPVPFAYVMPCVPGSTWPTKERRSNWPAANYVKVAGQVGDMIGRCCSPQSDSQRHVMDTFIIPHLQLYLDWEDPGVAPYKELIRGLLERANELRKLPLCFTHWDINMMNIMVSDDADICGILDWEESYWMPLGMTTFYEAKFPPHPSHTGVLLDKMATYKVPTDLSVLVYLTCVCRC